VALLCKIIDLCYFFIIKVAQISLTNDPDGNSVVIFICNALTILALILGLGLAWALLVLAVSLQILLVALVLAYLAAFGWSKICRRLTPSAQEMYLLLSTVGLTVLVGTAIQLKKMQSADAQTLLVYWIMLLIVGFSFWGITLNNVSAAGVEPIVFTGKIKPTQRFHTTNVSKEIPESNGAQTYLKNLK
jgi:hypothetical protein